jgi:hypothetical protein
VVYIEPASGTPDKPAGYEGIRLYWTPNDLRETRERLKSLGYTVSELDDRSYGQTEFLLTDDTVIRTVSASRAKRKPSYSGPHTREPKGTTR